MARRRVLTDEERRARSRAACAKWRETNREAIRERARVLSTIPSVVQRLHLCRKALYAAKRQALVDAGYAPNPVGRPRVKRSSDGILFTRKNRDGAEGTTGPDAHPSQVGDSEKPLTNSM